MKTSFALASLTIISIIMWSLSAAGENNTRPSAVQSKSPAASCQDPEIGAFMKSVQRRIKTFWKPENGLENKKVILHFSILSDGTVQNLKISKSSGVPVADAAALIAIRKAAPFRHLPACLEPSAEVYFTFNFALGDFPGTSGSAPDVSSSELSRKSIATRISVVRSRRA